MSYYTVVWKVHESFFLQFLREINFGWITSAKCAIFSHFAVLNFDLSEFFALFEGCNLPNEQNPNNGKNANFRTFSKIDFT